MANVSQIESLKKLEAEFAAKRATLLEKASAEAQSEVELLVKKLTALNVDFPQIVSAAVAPLIVKGRQKSDRVVASEEQVAMVLGKLDKKTPIGASVIAADTRLDRLIVSNALAQLRIASKAKADGKGRSSTWLKI